MTPLHPSRSGRLAGALAVVLAATACAGVPEAPVPGVPVIAPGEAFPALPGGSAPESAWWTGFDDPEVQRLVETALTRSPVLRGADASVAEAEALLRLALLGRSPSLSSSASATASRPTGGDDDFEASGNAGLAADWELDAFGRLGAAIEAARFDEAAARELRRDIAVSVASETALAYIDLRSAEARLAVAGKNAATQKESLGLVQTLFDNGRANELDLNRSQTQYRTTLASLPVFEASIADARSRLAALTGSPATLPAPVTPDAGRTARVPRLAATVSAGSPEEMLRRRPDVRLAEARIGAALALGDAARANLFPRITLNADLFGVIRDSGVAFNEDSIGLSFGPAISWAGPDLRRVYAQIDVNDARTMGAAADYEAAVLDALSDAETALSNYVTERQRRADLEAAFSSAKRAYELARLRFQEGLDSSLDVLDAQRTLLDAEDRLAVNEAEIARRAVRAYRSLGGIWTDEDLAAFRAEQEQTP
ncbi:MAG: TolC family protein [Acidobacteria bacterium]|nr:TolC family protein [Acidobacteriota bacterium]